MISINHDKIEKGGEEKERKRKKEEEKKEVEAKDSRGREKVKDTYMATMFYVLIATTEYACWSTAIFPRSQRKRGKNY